MIVSISDYVRAIRSAEEAFEANEARCDTKEGHTKLVRRKELQHALLILRKDLIDIVESLIYTKKEDKSVPFNHSVD